MSGQATPVEQAILGLLQPVLKTCNTFEIGLRPVLFSGDKISKGFRPEEMPVCQIEEGVNPDRSRPFTTGEMRHFVSVTVMLVLSSLDEKEVRFQMLALQRQAHDTLNGGRRSGVLGVDIWVTGDIVASLSMVQDNERFFGLAQLQVEITQVVQIGD